LNGEGAFRFGGRWSSPGVRIAYTAEYVSLAMVEYFVHVGAEDPPRDLVLITAKVPDEVSRRAVNIADLPPNWRQTPSPPELQAIGDLFALEAKEAILIVPSAIVPREANWLINPQHESFPNVSVSGVEDFDYDARFFTGKNQ
jgi:RES domain-containing protein